MRRRSSFVAALFALFCLCSVNQAEAQESDFDRLLQEGIEAYHRSRYQEALSKWEQGLELAKRSIKGGQAAGGFLGNIGIVYAKLGQYEKALQYDEQALAIHKEIGDHNGEGKDLGNIGSVYEKLGQYEKALQYDEHALVIAKEIRNRNGEGAALSYIGIVYARVGQYEKALHYCEQALAIYKEIGDRDGEGKDLSNIGNVYARVGQYEKALQYYEQALAIHKEIGDRNGEGKDLSNIGNVYARFGQYEKALQYYEQALAIHKEIGDRSGEGNALGNIGAVYERLGQYEKALQYCEQALAIHKEIGDRDGEGNALGTIGTVYERLGQYEKARQALSEGLKISREVAIPELIWRDQRGLGEAETKLGRDAEAASHYEQALDTIEAMRAGLSEEGTKTSFMRDKLLVYDELIELYQTLHRKDPSKGYDRRAFETFERKQGRVFLEEMGKSGARHFAGIPAAVRDKETELENRSAKIQADLVSERSKPVQKQESARIQNLEGALRQIQASQQALREEIRAKYPDYYALKYPRPATLKEIQEKLLAPDEVLLVYGVQDKASYLWVVGKKQFGSYALDVGEKALAEKVKMFRKGPEAILAAINRGNTTPREVLGIVQADLPRTSLAGREIYELLIPEGARKTLSAAKTLYIVPTGALYNLPFEALVSRMDGQTPRYLVEDHAVAYLSSASLLKILRDAEARRKGKAELPLLAFADPVYAKSEKPASGQQGGATTRGSFGKMRTRAYLDLMGGSFPELPETEQEVRDIKTILQAPDASRPLQLRWDASRSNVFKLNEKDRLADYRYVIFACHGVVPDAITPVTQPALVLSHPDPDGTDGFLTMADAFGLKLNADLVTLSACNTGRGNEVRGEGVMGLTRAFMYAGTPAISVTLWSVESESARRLSTGFYEGLKAGKGRAEALREVKLRMIRGEDDEMYRDPFFWAPVVLFGDGR